MRIKKFTDTQHICTECKSPEMNVEVYLDYYHVLFIPLMPIGYKKVTVRCKHCGTAIRLEAVEKAFENTTRTPFYIYGWGVLILGIIAVILAITTFNAQRRQYYVNNPKVNDVYVLSDSSGVLQVFVLRKVVQVSNDSVSLQHSSYNYIFEPDQMDAEDFFAVEDTIRIARQQLKTMLEKDVLVHVARDDQEFSK